MDDRSAELDYVFDRLGAAHFRAPDTPRETDGVPEPSNSRFDSVNG